MIHSNFRSIVKLFYLIKYKYYQNFIRTIPVARMQQNTFKDKKKN